MVSVSAITEGIIVSAEVTYRPEYSRPEDKEYIFTYQITIENCSKYTIQLLSRHWHIFGSNNIRRETKGEGVIGKQPVLEPGDSHKYTSACNLSSEFGNMHGTYTMHRISDDRHFEVEIPVFTMEVPFKLN